MTRQIFILAFFILALAGCFSPQMTTMDFRRQLAMERARCEEQLAGRVNSPTAIPSVPLGTPSATQGFQAELTQVAAERDALRVKLEAAELRLAEATKRLERAGR